MLEETPRPLFVRIAVTVALLLAVVLVVFVNGLALEWVGWLEPFSVCLWGSLGVFAISRLARNSRHGLFVPPGAFVAVAAVFIGLAWTTPLTPRTRFFADTAPVRIGMTINEVRTRLPQYPMACDATPGMMPPEAVAATLRGFKPHFTGYVLCASAPHSSSFVQFEVKDGTVTDIFRYSDD